jgi:hypothetical protein
MKLYCYKAAGKVRGGTGRECRRQTPAKFFLATADHSEGH